MEKHDFEIRRQEYEMKNEEHSIMIADLSNMDPQLKAYYASVWEMGWLFSFFGYMSLGSKAWFGKGF